MATSTSASTSTSHTNTNTYIYEVFINHRGPDVKEGLATLLYQGLRKTGLRVFLDRDEMQAGEKLNTQIEGAIRQASVHLAIFSPNYASSPWCLNELVLMEETQKPIIPIFYNVNPADLRWTQDRDRVYARDLRTLEKKTTSDSLPRHDTNTIQKWRKALSDAADISGFELSARNNNEELLSKEELARLEEQVVSKVIKRVSELASKTPLTVALYPTGLADKIEELEITVNSSQQQTPNLATAAGIVGLGGVGKTTLAKLFFNSHRSNYQRSCFLLDVRENVARNSLNSLQVQLIKDLAQRNEQISTPDEGVEMLKRYLPSSHGVLIILDDVDHIDQLHTLFSPVKDIIHSRSLILVTSRNKDVLTSAEIAESSIYMLKGLNQQYSQELFCSHAFNQPYPVIGFEQLVEKFLDACDGLPLSLKVIGALLCGKRDLKEQLCKISKILPKDIRSRLKISYDGLDEEEKQIFLDIACFFIGEKRDTAIRIWDGSRWQGWFGFSNLENRCLVEVDNGNCIRMHEHLRDLGRYLAKNSENPGRFWRLIDNPDLSSHSFVRGIHMFHANDAEIFLEDLASSCNISRLQLLRAEGDFVERVFSVGHLRQLIYLHWVNCPHSYFPPSIPIRNLRVLHIKGAFLRILWQDESQAPLHLRELVVIAEILMIPKSIGKLELLEIFVLRSNYIRTLPDSLGNLRNLQSLDLSDCPRLQMLPDSVGNMKNLQSLDLGRCSGLQMLPDSVGNMTKLQSLDLCWCSGLQTLPDSVGNMKNLQSLDLSGCSGLQMLPDSVGNMTNLQSLDLTNCSSLQMLPDLVGNMTNLLSLDLTNCSSLQMLPDSVGNVTNLQSLDLTLCSGLQMLPDSVGNMTNLQSLNLTHCSRLQMLPDSFGNMTNLQTLRLKGCYLQMLPDSVGNMTNLRSLDLTHCSRLQMLPDSVGNMTNLQSLNLTHCSRLQMLPDSVGNMTNLQTLNLDRCSRLPMLPDSVGNMTNLRSLDLTLSSGLQMLPDSVGNMTNLQSLKLTHCSRLQMLPDSFGNMMNLQTLRLKGCYLLQMLPDSVGNITNLQSLDLTNCSSLQMLPDSVGNMTNLLSLDLTNCSSLQMLPDSVGNITNLQSLDLTLCSGLRMLPDSVGNMTNLQSLHLTHCSRLQMLPDSVGNMMNLQTLNLDRCSRLLKLPYSVGNMTNLRSLDLTLCSGLQMLPDSFGNMTNLQSLNLTHCSRLQMLPDSFGNMTNLQTLRLKGCYLLQMLPDSVGNMTNLQRLDLDKCLSLQMLPDSIGNMTNLKFFSEAVPVYSWSQLCWEHDEPPEP